MPNLVQIRSKLWPFIRNKEQTDRQTRHTGSILYTEDNIIIIIIIIIVTN